MAYGGSPGARRPWGVLALVGVPGDYSPKVVEGLGRARDLLGQLGTGAYVIVLEASDAAVQDWHELDERVHLTASSLGLDEEERSPAEQFLAPDSLVGECGIIVRAIAAQRLTYVTVTPLKLERAVDVDAALVFLRAQLRSIIENRKSPDVTEPISALRRRSNALMQRRLNAELHRLTELTRQVLAASAGVSATDALTQLFGYRVELRNLLVAVAHHDADIVFDVDIRAALGDSDSLVQFVLAKQSFDQAETASARARAEKEREEVVTRLATALLIPTIWTTFWSTRGSPDLGSWTGGAVAVGAVVLTVISWMFAPKIIEFLGRRR